MAEAATPTAPPPVTILTSSPIVGRGDIFITPVGDPSTYANGPEIVDRAAATSSGSTPFPQGEDGQPTSAPRPTTGSRC